MRYRICIEPRRDGSDRVTVERYVGKSLLRHRDTWEPLYYASEQTEFLTCEHYNASEFGDVRHAKLAIDCVVAEQQRLEGRKLTGERRYEEYP